MTPEVEKHLYAARAAVQVACEAMCIASVQAERLPQSIEKVVTGAHEAVNIISR